MIRRDIMIFCEKVKNIKKAKNEICLTLSNVDITTLLLELIIEFQVKESDAIIIKKIFGLK